MRTLGRVLCFPLLAYMVIFGIAPYPLWTEAILVSAAIVGYLLAWWIEKKLLPQEDDDL